MAELLKNDDKSIRSYILNDVLEKVPIDISHENLCKVIGNDAIAFYDFQFWYYRFLIGKQDLDFDRSSEPEPLQFSDLPVDAVGLIADKLKVEEILMLRKVSKPLREFIEKQVFDCTKIAVSYGNSFISVWYGNREILYAKNDDAAKLYKESVFMMQKPSIMHGDHYESEAFNDLAWILKNPKLQLDCLQIMHKMFFSRAKEYKAEASFNFFKSLKLVLESLKHQIAVRELSLRPDHPDNLLAILPYLKPGYLKEILIDDTPEIFDWKSDENSRKVEQMMQLDQWKQAEKLILPDSFHLFPDEVFVQFKKYWIKLWSLNRSRLNHIGIKLAASPIFEHCYLNVYDSDDVEDFIDSIGLPGPAAEGYRSVRHHMIPNTDKLLVFKVKYGDVEIEKKTRDAQ